MVSAGIVLAAGDGSRMGRNKLLLRLGGESLLRRAVRTAVDAGLDPVMVVLGHEADRALEELSGLPFAPVLNPRHASGMGTSLAAGIGALPSSAAAAVVLLADMPFVTAAMIRALVARRLDTGAPLVGARYGAAHAPPTLFARALFGELRAVEGDLGAREVVQRHRAEAAWVSFPEAALVDLDDTADLERARARLGEERT